MRIEGANLVAIEHKASEKVGGKYAAVLADETDDRYLAVKLAGVKQSDAGCEKERYYGQY